MALHVRRAYAITLAILLAFFLMQTNEEAESSPASAASADSEGSRSSTIADADIIRDNLSLLRDTITPPFSAGSATLQQHYDETISHMRTVGLDAAQVVSVPLAGEANMYWIGIDDRNQLCLFGRSLAETGEAFYGASCTTASKFLERGISLLISIGEDGPVIVLMLIPDDWSTDGQWSSTGKNFVHEVIQRTDYRERLAALTVTNRAGTTVAAPAFDLGEDSLTSAPAPYVAPRNNSTDSRLRSDEPC